MDEHPVRLVVEDDLHRNRATVFFRILLAIPHLIWVTLWTIGVFFVSILNWLITLIAGKPPDGIHRFMASYIRYVSHLNAYLWLAANPYPGFVGEEGEYPIDIRLPGPSAQARWKTFLRIFIAVPSLLISTALGGGSVRLPARSSSSSGYYATSASVGGLSVAASILGWFASVVRGRMPKGLRDASAYSVGYSAQLLAYLLLVTDRYPNSDPVQLLETVERPPLHPVHLVGDAHDLRRSRVLVFFRLPLAIPHLLWLALWTVAIVFVVFVHWFIVLFRGRPAGSLHRFVERYVRYTLHVYAFLFLAANPFPGFVGAPGTYPLDLVLPPAERQNRWITGFRFILLIPAAIVVAALSWALYIAAFLTWFVALARGQAPWGLRNLAAYALRYSAQYSAYALLLTDRYPHASPLEGAQPEPEYEQFELETA